MAKFLSWKIKWMRVWNLCCPFIFCNIVCWLWVLYFFPAHAEISLIGRNHDTLQCAEISKLRLQNKTLKRQYEALHSQALEKISFAYGQKAELHRQLQEWQAKAIDLEITMSGGESELTDYKTRKAFFAPALQKEESEVELDRGPIPLMEPKNERQEE